MYLRYGDPSWDAAETSADAAPPTTASSARRHGGRDPAGNSSNKRKADGRSQPGRQFPRVTLAGVKLDAITEQQCIAHVLDELGDSRGGMLVTPNLGHLLRCSTNPACSAFVPEAGLVLA